MKRKSKNIYPPLHFIKLVLKNDTDIFHTHYKNILPEVLNMDIAEFTDEDDFIESVMHPEFMIVHNISEKTTKNPDRLLKLSDNVLQRSQNILQILGYKNIAAMTLSDIRCEIRDILVQNLMLNKWQINKQVLKPDPVFAKYLINTDQIALEADNLRYLPYKTFYLDLSDEKFNYITNDNIHGCFINVIETENNTFALNTYMLSYNNITYSHYIGLDLSEPQTFNVDVIPEKRKYNITPAISEKLPSNVTGIEINLRSLTTLTIQLLLYMNVKTPDIEESEETRVTYRAPEKDQQNKPVIKNKYSEISKQEIGFKVGKRISHAYETMKKAETEMIKYATAKNRKPPVPHFRAAHWHKYRTGKGRQNCELRWIEPVFVCGNFDSSKTENPNVIIHKVTE